MKLAVATLAAAAALVAPATTVPVHAHALPLQPQQATVYYGPFADQAACERHLGARHPRPLAWRALCKQGNGGAWWYPLPYAPTK